MKNESATKNFFKIFGILSLTLFIIGGLYFSIFLSTPLKMHEYTLNNGKQTIVFQEMAHIGKTEFYETVDSNLKVYREEGFIYAYEQVLVKTREEAERLTELTGLASDTYGLLASYLELDNQKNHMGYVLPQDINADMNASELIGLMEAYKENNPEAEELELDFEDSLQSLEDSSSASKWLLKAGLRGMLKLARKNTVDLGEGVLKDVILKKRDQKLFEKINELEADKIVIHYGALHFNGFFQKLKEQDSNWKIIKEERIEVF